MPTSSRLILIFKTIQELGWQKTSLYACYQLGLWTGHYRRLIDPRRLLKASPEQLNLNLDLFTVPSSSDLHAVIGYSLADLTTEADQILSGKAHLFGGPASAINLTTEITHHHWTAYETGSVVPNTPDVKLLWEPARFGWAFTLGRAFIATGDEKYPEAFWHHFEQFLATNTPYDGPQWMSAQEAAFRIIAFSFAAVVFSKSPSFTRERQIQLASALAVHAERIPPTLVYARAQNNNHLLMEAAGLYTAGKVLPNHPHALAWRETGWKWFSKAILDQIRSDGTYVQHSVNYHRLMLQVALWINNIAGTLNQSSLQCLQAATSWLLPLVDPRTGRCPNLGPNDGALLFPLAGSRFEDFRPVCQSASLVFLEQRVYEPGPGDELAVWLAGAAAQNTTMISPKDQHSVSQPRSPHLLLSSSDGSTWAYLRAVEFTSRPGHADQLHLDLWWQGVNIAQDAGTYSYNQPSPWNNPFASTKAHNTIMVNNEDQMTCAGRFLWLDWAQARVISQETHSSKRLNKVTAEHDGYRKLGITHRRTVHIQENQWEIIDSLQTIGMNQDQKKSNSDQASQMITTLFWHMPDFSWNFTQSEETDAVKITLIVPDVGTIELSVQLEASENNDHQVNIQVIRAGVLMAGDGIADPTLGWFSPTYNVKAPALTLAYQIIAPPPVTLVSLWHLA